MAQFATVTEFKTLLGKLTLEARDEDAIALILQLASASIQNYTRQDIELVAGDVVKLRGGYSSDLWLPQRPVTAVTTVQIGSGAALSSGAFGWDRMGLLRRLSGNWIADNWSGANADVITVTYSHGYATIPDDIKGVCLSLAVRKWENPAGIGETTGEGDPGLSFARQTGFVLTAGEKKILDRYRRKVATL